MSEVHVLPNTITFLYSFLKKNSQSSGLYFGVPSQVNSISHRCSSQSANKYRQVESNMTLSCLFFVIFFQNRGHNHPPIFRYAPFSWAYPEFSVSRGKGSWRFCLLLFSHQSPYESPSRSNGTLEGGPHQYF